VTLSSTSLLQELAALTEDASPAKRLVVAFSGGLDSTVLLHALSSAALDVPILAVHVDHGLQSDSEQWRAKCEVIAADFAVEFRSERVHLDDFRAQGVEAAAREARYHVFASHMQAGDWILSAHHRDDQAETLLLNLVRGAGPAGLAGIAKVRPFGEGWLARPLLQFSRSDLQDYATLHDLSWLEDPSNIDQRFDRNFLRHEILPKLESRWPEAARCLQRSSTIASDAATLLDELAEVDVVALSNDERGERIDRLRIDGLGTLSLARQRNVLRYAVRRMALPLPSAAHVDRVLNEVVAAREDAEPVVRWQGAEIRRYRNFLYLLAADDSSAPDDQGLLSTSDAVQLHNGLGILRLEFGAGEGLSTAMVEHGLELRYRHGGEKFKPIGQAHTKQLKKLLQEAGIVPWMRDRIPLLFSGGELVAVADLWMAAGAASKPGVAIHWEDRPAIH
jgi:tRNA(Ile)-lysidine synthase